MINWPIKHISLALDTRHLVSPGIMLICSESEPVQHKWDLTAVCKFPEERGNKVHKQPAASANLQACGVQTQVHQDTPSRWLPAEYPTGLRSETMGKNVNGGSVLKGPWEMPQFPLSAPEASA